MEGMEHSISVGAIYVDWREGLARVSIEDYMIAGIHLVFTVTTLLLVCLTSSKTVGPGKARGSNTMVTTHITTLLAVGLGVAHFAAGILGLTVGSSDTAAPPHLFILFCSRGLVWVVLGCAVRLLHSRKFYLPQMIKIWFMITFLTATFDAVTASLDLGRNGSHISMEIALALASWPVAALLLYCATRGYCSPAPSEARDQLSEPLLKDNGAPDSTSCNYATDNDDDIGTPYSTAGFLSRMTFAWLNPLLRLGRKGTLESADMPLLSREDKAAENFNIFTRTWEKEMMVAADGRQSSSIFWVLVSCYWRRFAVTGFYAFLKSAMVSLGPIVVNLFIDYAAGNRAFKYEGFALVAGLAAAKLAEVVSQRQWNFGDRRIGIQIRSALSAAIYQKELRLSTSGKQGHTAGEITNYIAVDAFKVGEFPYWLHSLWTTPLQIILVSSILFVTVGGWGTIVGMGVILLTLLANAQMAETQQKRIAAFTKAQDTRMRAITEVLRNIKILKLQAWEEKFLEEVDSARREEMKALKLWWDTRNLNVSVFWGTPVLVPIVTFAACVALGTPLNSRNVFTALACFRIIQQPMSAIPDVLAATIQMRVSLSRIEQFLEEDELKSDAVIRDPPATKSGIAVEIVHGEFSWESSTITLTDISLEVKRGQTVAVCGSVGSGRSSLLCAILGEISKGSGIVRVAGSVAYVSQSAWIQSGTLRDNILLGKPMDNSRYKQVLDACALSQDLESFDFGDLTELGERGSNLSGGQKQRLQLARALYQDADIYLLDDPFSAVDAHTSSSLFQECILGLLAKKTVILVTHQVEFLPTVDHIVLLQQGRIYEEGKFEDLVRSGESFQQLVAAGQEGLKRSNSNLPIADDGMQKKAELEPEHSQWRSEGQSEGDNSGSGESRLTKDEEKELGSSEIEGYVSYYKTANNWLWLWVALFLFAIYLVANIGGNWWLARQLDKPGANIAHLIIIYAVVVLPSTLLIHVRGIICLQVSWRASQVHFERLKNSVFHAPMAFFDSTPAGRILTRFSTDLHLLDVEVPFIAIYTVFAFFFFTTTALVAGLGAWQMVLIALPMFACTVKLLQYYLASANQLMRIYGTTRSPILNHSAESIAGTVSIRAYEVQDQFMRKNLQLIDVNASPYFHSAAAMEWLALRVEALSAAVLCASAFFVFASSLSPGMVGLVLSYGLSINVGQFAYVNCHCRAANFLISVERIRQYMNIPSEAPLTIEQSRPPSDWPTKGKVELRNLQLRYRPEAPLVLRGITCTIEGGQKVGIVGRTGSGKSTLTSVLFRLVEPTEGQVLIDDLDISTLGLHDLRSKLSIIPQEPTLFQGTVRFNLDPMCQSSDAAIWEALDKCRLAGDVRVKGGLDDEVGEDGDNWSLGQKQLFCLARAVLRKSQILVLDEATASIDNITDKLLQQTIQQQFSKCTVITVAHRIPTVINCDLVMTLSDGVMMEFDQPETLLKSKSSLFAKLVSEYWTHSHHS